MSTIAQDLRVELERTLGERVTRVTQRRHAHRSSFGLETLEVDLAGGRRLHLVRKDLSRDSLDDNASRAKPSDLHDPLREIHVYADLLARLDLGTPGYFGCVVDEQADRYWLFLEDVPGVPIWQDESPRVWVDAVRWLAALHEQVTPRARSLLRYDRAQCRRLAEPGARELGVGSALERALDQLEPLPAGLVHGDFYPANVLVDGRRICVLDWEAAGAGPVLFDLAAFVAGWPEGEVAALADAYRAALADPPPRDVFRETLDCCRLLVALRWVGWTREWSPPPQHTQDWAETALHIAARLGG